MWACEWMCILDCLDLSRQQGLENVMWVKLHVLAKNYFEGRRINCTWWGDGIFSLKRWPPVAMQSVTPQLHILCVDVFHSVISKQLKKVEEFYYLYFMDEETGSGLALHSSLRWPFPRFTVLLHCSQYSVQNTARSSW